jgi:hypothetical protein
MSETIIDNITFRKHRIMGTEVWESDTGQLTVQWHAPHYIVFKNGSLVRGTHKTAEDAMRAAVALA